MKRNKQYTKNINELKNSKEFNNFVGFLVVVASLIITTFAVVLTIKWVWAIFSEKKEPAEVNLYKVWSNVICDNKLGVVIGLTDKRNIVSYWTGKDYIWDWCEEVKELNCNSDWYKWCMINL